MTQVMGIKHTRDGIEAQSVIGADMAVIGIIGTAPNANSALAPLNKSLYTLSNDSDTRAALGSTGMRGRSHGPRRGQNDHGELRPARRKSHRLHPRGFQAHGGLVGEVGMIILKRYATAYEGQIGRLWYG